MKILVFVKAKFMQNFANCLVLCLNQKLTSLLLYDLDLPTQLVFHPKLAKEDNY